MIDIINSNNNLIITEKIINKNFKKEDIINQRVKMKMKFLFPKKEIKTEIKFILIMYIVITLMMTIMMKLMILKLKKLVTIIFMKIILKITIITKTIQMLKQQKL